MQRLLFILILCSLMGCNNHDFVVDEKYRQDLDQWKDLRIEVLKRDWVSLSGLDWIDSSFVRIGSDSLNDIIFPEDMPGEIGTLHQINDSTLIARFTPGIELLVDSVLNTSDSLIITSTSSPLFHLNDSQWKVIRRNNRFAVRSWRFNTEKLNAFQRGVLEYYDPKSEWIVQASFEEFNPPKEISVQNIMGYNAPLRSPGTITFDLEGKLYTFYALDDGSEDLFIIFNDLTNGESTYGGGRYTYIPLADENGKTILDFNKVYNPPCVFSPFATCPLPPPQNRLDIALTAGEKMYDDGY